MEPRRCFHFGLLQVCDGDKVIVELSRGDVVVGVVRVPPPTIERRVVYVTLADDCDKPPIQAIRLKKIARIVKIGVCSDERDRGADTGEHRL